MNRPIVVSHYICATCKKPIIDYNEGFHIKGNITFADPNSGKGLIGNGIWLGKMDRCERIFDGDIPETVMCKPCFCHALDIGLSELI